MTVLKGLLKKSPYLPHYYMLFHGVEPSGNCYQIKFLV
jgi:hypothetical protein